MVTTPTIEPILITDLTYIWVIMLHCGVKCNCINS